MAWIEKNRKKRVKIYTTKDEIRHKVYASSLWKRMRLAYLDYHPMCEDCAQKGIVKPAEDVHHVRSFMTARNEDEMLQLAYDYNNLRALCKQCHQLHHVR